ncbi:fibrinogen-related protein 3.1 [Elysia marginata]|uniref:Fibrinogen-related protein 3.1 n=1 Tax=Elysia marginata TaxID=1093978 RepID=A0AAV4I1J4_9GAST|nr:fibrinogen-related protein 3.1 [Elysia marginata]
MLNTVAPLVLVMLGTFAHPQGLELSLDRVALVQEEGSPCSQAICRVNGNSVTINSVTVSNVKVNEEPSDLLAVTTDAPEMHSRADNIRGNGTLVDNSAIIFIDLVGVSACESEVVTCEVTYTRDSGETGEAFTVAGPGKLPKFQAASTPERESPVASTKAPTPATAPFKTGNPYLSELWFLGDKITKVEGKFETLSDRLDRKLRKNLDAVQSRAGSLENSVLQRVSSVETDLSSRVSRLEDRVSSILLPETPDTRSDVAQAVVHLERRLDEVIDTLDQMNQSKTVSHHGEHETDQPVTCERGMGDDVTKTYPRYLMTYDATLGRKVLCETQRDGGGWIVFQGDFYKDWTSYREGFGSLTGDFYLGNDAIHSLTDGDPYELRIDVRINGRELFAEYTSFRIEDESNKYRLRLGTYSGTIGEAAGEGLSYSNNKPFSTFDRDNDDASGNCAMAHHGAWWYSKCHTSNLNGIWLEKTTLGISWYTGSAWVHPDFTEMKIRRVRPNTSS